MLQTKQCGNKCCRWLHATQQVTRSTHGRTSLEGSTCHRGHRRQNSGQVIQAGTERLQHIRHRRCTGAVWWSRPLDGAQRGADTSDQLLPGQSDDTAKWWQNKIVYLVKQEQNLENEVKLLTRTKAGQSGEAVSKHYNWKIWGNWTKPAMPTAASSLKATKADWKWL